jgi:hypothetical protein
MKLPIPPNLTDIVLNGICNMIMDKCTHEMIRKEGYNLTEVVLILLSSKKTELPLFDS